MRRYARSVTGSQRRRPADLCDHGLPLNAGSRTDLRLWASFQAISEILPPGLESKRLSPRIYTHGIVEAPGSPPSFSVGFEV